VAGLALFRRISMAAVEPMLEVAGSLLFLLHSILDGCDAELARLKFLESRRGAPLEFWVGKLGYGAVWSGMAIGWSLGTGAAWPLPVCALAVASTAASAPLVSRQGDNGLGDAMANRDFIYMVGRLACFGRAHWFLVRVALGTPAFMLLVRWGAGRRRIA
jgi:phosphatidylglycerophosphate synthase